MQVMQQQALPRAERRSWEAYALPLLLLIALVIGLVTVRQYGESWDELQFYKYADRALQAYSTWAGTGLVPLTGNTYDNYGPAYVMAVALGARLLGYVLPWITSDLRHLLYFITYVIGIWAFYTFSRRWLSAAAAAGATLLFSTQPLFWGHAFISPKDIPFLAFFILSLEFGFRMVDASEPVKVAGTSPGRGRKLITLTLLWLALLLGAFLITPLVRAQIGTLVNGAAAGQANLLTSLGRHISMESAALYAQRYFTYFLWSRAALFLVSAAVLLWYWRKYPPAIQLLLCVLPAAVLLGVTTSIRVLGPFAGLIVAGYALWTRRRAAFPVLAVYAFIALIAMYLTWPYLWPDPLGHLIESVRVMSAYPWQGQVLFNGVSYASTDLPLSYLPVLLGLQLTEPVWLLFAMGLGIAAFEARMNRSSRALLILASVWFILPLAGFILTRSPLYDNFRQVFFILPPVFMLSGLVLEKVRRPVLQAALIGLLILPGIIDSLHLHPYEYIYYNRFTGGVSGAYRKFELDYWGTSYREAAEYLNRVAPPNATVWAEGPVHLLQLYARPDIKIFSTYESARADHYTYVVALSRDNLDRTTYPDAPVIHMIERDGANLTVIKQP